MSYGLEAAMEPVRIDCLGILRGYWRVPNSTIPTVFQALFFDKESINASLIANRHRVWNGVFVRLQNGWHSAGRYRYGRYGKQEDEANETPTNLGHISVIQMRCQTLVLAALIHWQAPVSWILGPTYKPVSGCRATTTKNTVDRLRQICRQIPLQFQCSFAKERLEDSEMQTRHFRHSQH